MGVGLEQLPGADLHVAALGPLVVLVFVMGFFPTPFLDRMEPSVANFLAGYHAKLAEGDGPPRLLSDEYDGRVREQLARLRPGAATPAVAAAPAVPAVPAVAPGGAP